MAHSGGRPRKLNPIEEYAVYALHQEGKSQVEIAYKYGISTTTVFRIVTRIKEGEKNNGK